MNIDTGARKVKRLLLNCDMGESFGNWRMGLDADVMPYIDCANIACGYHAGDPSIMRRTVAMALDHGVTIGAHPAYPDLVGFGRRSMACSNEEIRDLLHYQIGALDGICRVLGGRVAYVKPHGALYNDMMADPIKLRTVLEAVAAYDAGLPVMLMATADDSAAQALGDEIGVPLWFEAFADRAYTASGHLVSRRLPGAVHHDPALVVEQALHLAHGEALVASDGSALRLNASTLCVHGDNDSSVAAVRQIRQALDALERA
ncbi:LamB/YcsF family protein [Pseudomonas sp. SWI6]|uniref:5-oxoprolinase subunit PxpA n=1 Tax=Pseudomonas TaxID=286 RepID=UPI00041497E7|nr:MULTISPECIES: 5-oxoprolinase subunit PxpA [Pseudomonas]AVD82118.1 LamB/YcsF family protein [Pseudomonas sp. SWI6]AVD89076.1 LamB/YcsF family protein [Pseudomonas sp. SWI44]MPS99315.1 LamB/YcsF family protein [Pseudomonas sp.]WEZ87462.1 LamB/YcsF family protein [Pseudomonas sp. NyZ480]